MIPRVFCADYTPESTQYYANLSQDWSTLLTGLRESCKIESKGHSLVKFLIAARISAKSGQVRRVSLG
jgi:hypothetical protein